MKANPATSIHKTRSECGERGELSTAVICLFDLNATAETAERSERREREGEAAMFVEMPPKGTQRQTMSFSNAPKEVPKEGASKMVWKKNFA